MLSTVGNRNKIKTNVKFISDKLVENPSYNDVVLFRELLKKDLSYISDALLYSVYYFTNRYHLLTMGLALRYSANPNMYIRIDNKSPKHIIYYLGNKWLELSTEGRENKLLLFRAAIALLVMAGSDINKLAVDEYAGRNLTNGKTVKDVMMKDMKLLIKFQIETQYNDKTSNYMLSNEIEEADNLKLSDVPWIIGPKLLEFVGIVLDRPGMLVQDKLNPVNLLFIFITDADTFFNREYTQFDVGNFSNNLSKSITDSVSINASIEYISNDSFKQLLYNGHFPSYIAINNLILLRIRYKDDNIISPVIDEMLLYAVKYGAYIDNFQLELLRSVTDTSTLEKEYKKPFWRKFLLNFQHYTYYGHGSKESEKSRLWDLIFPLSINPKMNIVDIGAKFHDEIIILNQEELTSALRLSTKKRALSDINLRLGGGQINFSNTADIGSDKFDYGYMDSTLYYDKKNDTYWLFLRNRYIELVQSGKSIYTGEYLDKHFLSILTEKITKYETINATLLLSSPIMLEDAINNLYNDIDNINNDLSDKIFSCFKKILKDKTLKPEQPDNILQKIGILSSVKNLKREHQLYTLAWIVRQYLKIGGDIHKIKEYVS